MAKRKPFFSIVVPCYNDGRYNENPDKYICGVLRSITRQGLKKSEVEVILSDDHSPVSYDDIIKRFNQSLNIVRVTTNYNFAPGNTRQKGADKAKGEWLCFIDHDDVFCDEALVKVKLVIEAAKEQHVVYTDFDKVDPDDNMNVVEEFRGQDLTPWVHGKFYNIDNFWKPYKIHFIKDLKTHEDCALGKMVDYTLLGQNIKPLYFSHLTYKWIYNRDSVSHATYFVDGKSDEEKSHNFLRLNFDDYLKSNISSALETYLNGSINKGTTIAFALSGLTSAWLTLANFKTDSIGHYLQINDAYCSRAWHEVKEVIGCNLVLMKVLIAKSFQKLVDEANETAKKNGVSETFLEWLQQIDDLDYAKIIEDFQEVASTKPEEETDEHRPFFSCIIACYNDGRYKEGVYLDRLLSSLTRQDIPREELEVILSDDCSPKPFFKEMQKKYKDKLILKYIKTDYNFAPGNTRAKGVTIATGKWLCFADHDDIYYDGALKQVISSITEKDERHFAFGDFNGVNPKGEVTRKYECTLNWCHAKFYNKDNFWDKYGLHFVKDLKSHEDIAICTQVGCALASNVPKYTYIHVPLYAWTDNPQSVSHAKYTVETETGPREFLEVFYSDYIEATGYTYLQQFKEHKIKITYAIKSLMEIMCYAYFYQQGFMFRRPDDYYKKNLEVAGKYIDDCKEALNLNNDKIYKTVSADRAEMYYKVAEQAKMATGRYMPTQTFRQWLDCVSPDK